MTTKEMTRLNHGYEDDPLVKKLTDHYGTLFDAVTDYFYEVNEHGPDSKSALESYDKLAAVIDGQPNVDKLHHLRNVDAARDALKSHTHTEVKS